MFKIETIEIDGSTYNSASTYTEAKNLVLAQGPYKQIGSGAFGTVYGAKGSNMVYKIGDACDNKGYLGYVKQLAKAKAHNPFTPRVYGVRIYVNKNDRWDKTFVVAMERLERLKQPSYKAVNELRDLLRYGPKTESSVLGIKHIVPRALKQAIKVVKTAHKTSRASWDLHFGNFMQRGKQVVITDPLA